MPEIIPPIRWTIERAAAEFGIHRETLSSHIRAKSILAGPDEKYATADICRAVFSDLDFEMTELRREQKEMTRIKKLQLARKLCVLETVKRVWHSALVDMRQKVSNWPIDEALRQDLIRELQEIPTDEYFEGEAPTPEAEGDDDVP